MSFGKDPSQLDNIGTFGQGNFNQQAATSGARPPRGGGKGLYWTNNFELSEHPSMPDTWRILRGSYRQAAVNPHTGELFEDSYPYVMVRDHFHGASKKGALCSAGPYAMDKNKRQPCEGCNMFWEDWEERQAKKARGDNTRGPRRVSSTPKFVFSVLDYAYYFQMPQVDRRTGQFRINSKTNQPFTEWVKAVNPQDPRFAGHQWKQGDVRPWMVSDTWKNTLLGWNETIGMSCITCGARDTVASLGWYCGNPQCRQLIFDPNNTTLSPEAQREKRNSLYQCPHCQQVTYPLESVQCSNCTQPRRASIFDVDLVGYMLKPGEGQQTQLVIVSYTNPGPVNLQDPEQLKKVKPLDLLRKFAPTPVEEQRRLWNLGPVGVQNAPPPQNQQWAPPPGAPQPPAPPPQQPVGQGPMTMEERLAQLGQYWNK